ncbi:MAG: DUF4982 domain-containing protein [Clostridium sp.]|nr:DUF4982 domain-containing protein [Clostridium sp.]
MKNLAAIACSLFALTALAQRDVKIDRDWRFSPDSIVWKTVDLPHDWSIEGPYDRKAAANNDAAYLPTGVGYYTKTLNLPQISPNELYRLYFEGAYMDTDVKVNGVHAGGHPYGYSSFYVDITPMAKAGDNTIEVKVDNSRQRNSRWYSGSGLYRHVWLVRTPKIHLEPWALAITSPQVSKHEATVNINAGLINASDSKAKANVSIEILSPEGAHVASKTYSLSPNAGDTLSTRSSFSIEKPFLWSPDSPWLYTAVITATDANGDFIDEISEEFGIRKFDFNANRGLRLNGNPITLNGGCVHHDNGILGAASPDAAEARKVRLMKEAGFNAVRTSHNPPSPAFLDECDRQGLIVIDEAFDGWRDKKTEHDYAELIDQWWADDLSRMVLRDRNHPSIMCWSIGNEIIERKKIEAVKTAHNMAALCRAIDPSRPVTSALAAWDPEWDIYDPLAAEHDIVGYNYMIHKAESDHARVPGRVMWQTESYPRDAFSNWRMATEHPYVIGDFVWTAIDYIGESGIGRHYYKGQTEGEHYHRQQWPWHGSYCGDIDLTGARKPISLYRDFLYNHSKEEGPKGYLAVREPNGYKGEIRETQWGTYPAAQSWTWPGWEGKDIEIEAVTSYPQAKVYLNGKAIGQSPCNKENGFMAVFKTAYEPGVLKMVGVDSEGNEHELGEIATAGTPKAIRLTADSDIYSADGEDIAYILAEVVDANGIAVPIAADEIEFSVSGPATLLATGSADMTDMAPYPSAKRKAFQGRALAAVRLDKKGSTTISAKAPGLKTAKIKVSAK